MLILVLGLAGLGAGCFGIFSRGGGAEPTASVRVLNDVSPPATLTIELRVEGKNTATLGTVEPGQDRVLSYSSSSLQGPYQLVAHQPSGAAVVSREFTLFNGARVQWQVRGNTLSVLQDR
jgi:hypothetical protein